MNERSSFDLLFLGSGGGRFNLTYRWRDIGGFLLYHWAVDPGPDSQRNMVDLKVPKPKGVILSHVHVDHTLGFPALAEWISDFGIHRRGTFIATRNAFGAFEYHRNKLRRHILVDWDNEVEGFRFVRCNHGDPYTAGFVYKNRIGYTADTGLYPGMADEYKDLDILILNVFKLRKNFWGHLTVEDAITLLKAARPKLAVMTHIGPEIIFFGTEKVRRHIEDATGIKTIVAQKGLWIKGEDWGMWKPS